MQLDKSTLPIAALTSALPVDAGEHEVQVSATGKRPWRGKITSRDAAEVSLHVPLLADDPYARSHAAAQAEDTNVGTTQRITALAVGGLGTVALGVGGFYALSAQSSYSDSNSYCNKGGFCTTQGTKLTDEAKSKASTATLFAGIGAAALVGAGVLWFTAPSRPSPAKPQTTGLRVRPHRAAWGLEVSSAW